MQLVAHRGVSSLAPENTLASLTATAALGLEWAEIDVQLTGDGVAVVFHDENLKRCTDGKGKLAKKTWRELQTLDAGSWFSSRFSNEILPSLDQVLQLADDLNLKLNIELKLFPKRDIEELCREVSRLIESRKLGPDRILFSSFSQEALEWMQQLLPAHPRGMLWDKWPSDALEVLKKLDAYSVHLDCDQLKKKHVKEAKMAGYKVLCFTANDSQMMERLAKLGVDKAFTDCPQDFPQYL